MLDQDTGTAILKHTKELWETEGKKAEFIRMAAGKEIGHRIADYVDEKTTTLLESHFDTVRERKGNGDIMPRSMGDIWVKSNGIYNPINVKAGEIGKNGQPNMVSLKKLLRALLKHHIDSYYLLIVKVALNRDADPVFHIYLADMLEHLDDVAFDSGPGQIMLREKQFYDKINKRERTPSLTMDEKIGRLFEMLEDADRRLQENRAKVAATIAELRDTYTANTGKPINQRELNLK